MKLLNNIFATLIILTLLNCNVFAKDNQQYPNISGNALFEARVDRADSANTSDVKSINGLINIDADFSLNINKNWSVITDWRIKQVKGKNPNDNNPERYRTILFNRGLNVEDEGLVVEQLKGQFENDDARFFFGKFNPAFGSAFRKEKRIGIFTTDFTKDYELREKIGAGFTALLQDSEIEFSLFSNDKTTLNESAIQKRDNLNNSDDLAGDKSSYSVAIKGKDLFAVNNLTYNFGYRNLAVRNIAGRSDEVGIVGGLEYLLPIRSEISFIPFIEISHINNLSGEKNRDALYSTVAIVSKYKSWTASISSIGRDIKQQNNISSNKDSQIQYSLGYKFDNNIILDATRARIKENGYNANLTGVNLSYSYNF